MTLTLDRLSKTFGSTRALDEVTFTVTDGHIHGLLGGNGSGKSTLVKILAGVYTGDPGGHIQLDGARMASDAVTPEVARSLGMRFVHQNSAIFPELTVAENIATGTGYPTALGVIRWPQLRSRTRTLLDRYAIEARPDDTLGDLRPADQTMVAVARALADADTASVLVLDEPTASLPEREVEVLLEALRRCAARGQTILYVSHRIDEILDLTTSVTVLRDGRHVVTRTSEGLDDARLIEYIVGRPIESVFADTVSPSTSERRLTVSHLRGGPLRDVSFHIDRGEIVGIAGLLGSGRTELLRMLFGALRPDAGEVVLDEKPVRLRSTKHAMQLGFAYVPENRELDAAFPDLSVRENITIASMRGYWRGLWFSHRSERNDVAQAIFDFAIRTASDQAPISSLSGGNQQKVILARWLMRQPRVLLLDEPTQGVDVGARSDVYAAIRRVVATGVAALLVSSDFDELAHASDRVLVLREGQVAAEARGQDLNREQLTELVYATELPA